MAFLAILLVGQMVLFAVLAPRGLDLTDESYALLSLIHWRDLPASPTLFAFFVGPLHEALGGSIAGTRIAGMVALLSAAAWAAHRVLAFASDHGRPPALVTASLVLAGMASGTLFYSFTATLRVPAYNLVVLVGMLAATGLLCDVLRRGASRSSRLMAATAYGVAVLLVGLTKPTSGAAMVVCHALFAAVVARGTPVRDLAGLAAAMAVGAFALLALVQLVHPNWLAVMRDGAVLAQLTDGRTVGVVLGRLFQDAGASARRLGPDAILGACVLMLLVWLRRRRRWSRGVVVWSLVAAAGVVVLGTLWRGYGKTWWLAYALLVVSWAWGLRSRHAVRPAGTPASGHAPTFALVALLMVLPVAFSLGTNGSLPAHTQMASMFAVLALLVVLQRLVVLQELPRLALAVCLAFIGGAGFVIQWPTLGDPAATYRLRAGLLDQVHPTEFGPRRAVVRVDEPTRHEVEVLRTLASEAGWTPGSPLIDLTGDGPGWVLALGGRPPGLAWVIGGYAGSLRAAHWALGRIRPSELAQSWVLTAHGNPRSVAEHPDWLRGIDPGLRYRLVGRLQVGARYSFDAARGAQPVTLSLWKPERENER